MKINNNTLSDSDQCHLNDNDGESLTKDEWQVEIYNKLQPLLKEIVEEKSVLALIDYINYLENTKEIYQVMFYNAYFKNFSESKNNSLEDYILVMQHQLDIIVKSYERHLKLNNQVKAKEAKKNIDRRLASLEFLKKNYNIYYELCINKGLEMLGRKELISEDINELVKLTNSLFDYNNLISQSKKTNYVRVRS